jgi:hypothetical protein
MQSRQGGHFLTEWPSLGSRLGAPPQKGRQPSHSVCFDLAMARLAGIGSGLRYSKKELPEFLPFDLNSSFAIGLNMRCWRRRAKAMQVGQVTIMVVRVEAVCQWLFLFSLCRHPSRQPRNRPRQQRRNDGTVSPPAGKLKESADQSAPRDERGCGRFSFGLHQFVLALAFRLCATRSFLLAQLLFPSSY